MIAIGVISIMFTIREQKPNYLAYRKIIPFAPLTTNKVRLIYIDKDISVAIIEVNAIELPDFIFDSIQSTGELDEGLARNIYDPYWGTCYFSKREGGHMRVGCVTDYKINPSRISRLRQEMLSP
ncbi:MAG: hypothetical protein JNM28_08390 [Armatimonadetes bacterium]|nr:hypothetical protein [Armatimonadota bacterium]